jgi:hypothetical protein
MDVITLERRGMKPRFRPGDDLCWHLWFFGFERYTVWCELATRRLEWQAVDEKLELSGRDSGFCS